MKTQQAQITNSNILVYILPDGFLCVDMWVCAKERPTILNNNEVHSLLLLKGVPSFLIGVEVYSTHMASLWKVRAPREGDSKTKIARRRQ